MENLSFNQLCGKLIYEARIKKNISVEELALKLLSENKNSVISDNNLNDVDVDNEAKITYLRRQSLKDEETNKLYHENIKKINYWENGNGFPDLNEIYKLAEIIDINPNEIYKLRELGRKNLKGENKISNSKFLINRFFEKNIDAFHMLFPALVGVAFLWFILKGSDVVHDIFWFLNQVIFNN